MKDEWRDIGSWNVGTSDGGVERYTLSENKTTGDIRIKNDFGNISIDMERMSGYKFIKKVVKRIEETMLPGDCDDDSWAKDYGFDDDSEDNNIDCDHTD